MTKIKNILAFAIFTIIIYACGDDNNTFTNPYADVNYTSLASSEKDSIETFLKSHYYDINLDSLKPLVTGEISMFDDVSRLKSTEVEQNDIMHKLYVYVTEVGMPDSKKDDPTKTKENPTEMDSIFVNRKGSFLSNNSINSDSPFDQGDENWWSLGTTFGLQGYAPSPIIGWVKGFPFFKSGQNITNNGPLTFQNTGKGYLFIPSGLAYSSITYQLGQQINPLYDQTIVFQIELLDIVEDTDHDNDGVASINEDADGDGDPTNDFSDTLNPTLPDYLNPNIK